MREKKIMANDIKECHPNSNASPTDQYYQRLANRLQDRFLSIDVVSDKRSAKVIHYGAILLTNYMEDIVADSGQWRTFSNLCQKLFGHPVPLYHDEEEYYPDEPSMNAIRYLLWSAESDVTGNLVFLDFKILDSFAVAAYEILDDAFEEAPVNEQLADDVQSLLSHVTEGVDQLRDSMTWIFNSCYLTHGENNDKLIKHHAKELLDVSNNDKFPDVTPYTSVYYANMMSIFRYRIGPLALYPKDYLAAMMCTKGMEHEAEELDKIEVLEMGTYKYEHIEPEGDKESSKPKTKWLRLTRTNGMEFELRASELNLSGKELYEFDGLMASSFVSYQGEWHLNGIMFPLPGVAQKWKELCQTDKENLAPGTEVLTGEKILELTDGQQMIYFANGEQVKDFLKTRLHFPLHAMKPIDERKGELPVIFIDTEDRKNGLQVFFDCSACIADPGNPFYDKEKARNAAINMLWNAGLVTTQAMNFLLDLNFLPDIYDNRLLSRLSTVEEKRRDIDFLLRFYRREMY